jgi:hypothetical protein
LDAGDSFFFKNISNMGSAYTMPVIVTEMKKRGADEFGGEAARDMDAQNARDPVTGRLVFEGGANFIEKYIRCGRIDVLFCMAVTETGPSLPSSGEPIGTEQTDNIIWNGWRGGDSTSILSPNTPP